MHHRQVKQGALGLLLLVYATAIRSADLIALEMTASNNRYRIEASFLVEAPAAVVRALLTDDENLPSLSPSILDSALIEAPNPDLARVKTRIKACVLLHCRTLHRVEDVSEGPNRLLAVIVPEHSDFAYGRTEWRLTAQDDAVRVDYRADLEPAFGRFPVVGPALMKAGLERELRTFLGQLQRRAEAD